MNIPILADLRQRSEHAYGLAITTLGVLVLCPDTLLIRFIEAEGASDPWSITAWRGVLTCIGLMLLFRLGEGPQAWDRVTHIGRWGLVAIVCMAFQATAFVVAVTLTTVANTLLIVATAPLFSALLSWLFLGERPPLRTWIAIVFALAGMAVIFSGSIGGDGSLTGDLAALGTAFGLGVGFVILRHRREVNMIPATALGNLLSAFVVLPLATPFGFTATGYLLLLVLGLVILPIAFGLITLGPRHIPAPEVSLLLLLESILAPLLVWLVIGEEPSRAAIVGGAIVLVTLALHAVAGYRRLRAVPAPVR